MLDALRQLAPSAGIVAVIALWVFGMLVVSSYFHRFVPEVSAPSRWNPAFLRLGLVLVLAILAALVGERQGLPPGLQSWLGLFGGALGYLAERLWRRIDARMRRSDRPESR